MGGMYNIHLIEWVANPISLDIGLVLLVFGSSYGLPKMLHRFVSDIGQATHPIRYILHMSLIDCNCEFSVCMEEKSLFTFLLSQNCDLTGCDLQHANLRGSNLAGTVLDNIVAPLHMSQTVNVTVSSAHGQHSQDQSSDQSQ